MAQQSETDAGRVAADAALLADSLAAIVGRNHVRADEAARRLVSADLSVRTLATVALVVAPGTVDELRRTVAAATAAGFDLVPRGGGMSYTMGYVPERDRSVSLDLRRLDKIVEINREDMYVVVETGVTWRQLFDAFAGLDVRTPYWGTLSGLHATVGGGLSQDAALFGSGLYGTAADNVLGLELVLADGSLLRTGSWARPGGAPFFRHWGPDLTGLFTADTGAFAVKARAVLPLVPKPPAMAAASFGFDRMEDMVAAQADITRKRLASECFGFDPFFNDGFEAAGISLSEGVEILGRVATSGRGLFRGLRDAFNIARTGKRVLRKVKYSLHVTVDALTDRAAAEALDVLRAIAREHGAWELVNAIPTVMRSAPFRPIRPNLLGPNGELWVPMHGFFPLSKAVEAVRATDAYLSQNRALMDRHGIRTSYLFASAATNFMLEPSFYWRDELGPLRLSVIEPEYRAKWQSIPADPAAREVVVTLRQGLADLHGKLGAVHQQVGKYYAFSRALDSRNVETLQALKRLFDPDGRVNPGALGLR